MPRSVDNLAFQSQKLQYLTVAEWGGFKLQIEMRGERACYVRRYVRIVRVHENFHPELPLQQGG